MFNVGLTVGASILLILGLVIRLVCLRKCGRFHEPEPKHRDQPELRAGRVRYSVGRAVCTHWQQSARVSAVQARTRIVVTHLQTCSDILYVNIPVCYCKQCDKTFNTRNILNSKIQILLLWRHVSVQGTILRPSLYVMQTRIEKKLSHYTP
jgi:hypothetical protein